MENSVITSIIQCDKQAFLLEGCNYAIGLDPEDEQKIKDLREEAKLTAVKLLRLLPDKESELLHRYTLIVRFLSAMDGKNEAYKEVIETITVLDESVEYCPS